MLTLDGHARLYEIRKGASPRWNDALHGIWEYWQAEDDDGDPCPVFRIAEEPALSNLTDDSRIAWLGDIENVRVVLWDRFDREDTVTWLGIVKDGKIAECYAFMRWDSDDKGEWSCFPLVRVVAPTSTDT